MSRSRAIDRRLSTAPMMNRTDRHFRYLMRLLSPHALLYTEMIPVQALLRGSQQRLLAHHQSEHPVALQLGGSDPHALAQAAKLAEQAGFNEVNLNVGCPSPRVQAASFGACLMAEPNLVANCIDSMREAVSIPVTIKTRIGIDEQDDYASLADFVAHIEPVCDVFIIHARKAWLSGLSPRENREVPPLRYAIVHKLKRDFPSLSIVINGGIKTANDIMRELQQVDGVMMGRAVYQDPYLIAEAEQACYGQALPTRTTILEQFISYITQEFAAGCSLNRLCAPIFGLYRGTPGARRFRRYLSEQLIQNNASVDIVKRAQQQLTEEAIATALMTPTN